MKTISKIYPVVIIGGGPSGIAAAIQLKRSDIKHLLIEKDECGGLLRNAYLVENYPGFFKAVSGRKLTSCLVKHLKKLNIEPLYSEVKNISYSNKEKLFSINIGKTIFKSRIIVVATGLKPKEPDIISKLSQKSQKIIYYNIYDLNNPKNKNILIVGAGDAAFDYALNLSRNNKVMIINRKEKIKALNLLQERVKNNRAIEYKKNTLIEHIIDDTQRIILNSNNQHIEKTFDIILFAIGRIPDLNFISSQIMKKRLELETNNVLYFIGDISNGNFRQASIAVGDGIKVAMEINKLLNK